MKKTHLRPIQNNGKESPNKETWPVYYRDFRIERKWITPEEFSPQVNEFEFTHMEYDGPEDHRLGHSATF